MQLFSWEIIARKCTKKNTRGKKSREGLHRMCPLQVALCIPRLVHIARHILIRSVRVVQFVLL